MSITLASSLPDVFNRALASHPVRPNILALEGKPWDVTHGARCLFTQQTQWKSAPSEPPSGWPFDLEWIQVASAGVDTLPPWAYKVPLVTRGAGAHAPAIAEFVIGAVFAHEKRFWNGNVSEPARWVPHALGSVAGKTMGIAGVGEIGRECARLALALGMRVCGMTRSANLAPGIERVDSFPALLAVSDHLVLALPLTVETRGIVNRETLRHARKGLHLINIARGSMIDDAALLQALDDRRLSGATLDVTSPEPLPAGHRLYTHPAVRLTPHISGAVDDADARMSAVVLANFDCWLHGRPLRGVVNPATGY